MTALVWAQSPTVKVEGGMIQGVPSAASDVTVFRGIPYAAPPMGDLRWKRPQPVVKWKGVKVADTFGNICWQPGNAIGTFYGNEFYWKENTVQSEDCLYLNVWTPASAVGNQTSKLPVAFWVHGGAYFNGYGHEITMDGDAWAKRGVILVTINYRLGIFGFLAHPELSAETPDGTSGNYGTYDQVAALKWVHDNIAQFGGDPDNITVLGQSAGAASIKNLVCSPLSKGLIKNAVIQSGGGIGAFGNSENGQKQAEATGKSFMDKFGYNSLKAMRAVPAEQLLEIFKAEGMNLYRPHIDGLLLTESFDDAARNQHLADEPFTFRYRDRILYSGTDSVRNGEFRFSFPVPLDINYSNQNGQILLYAKGNDGRNANGVYDNFTVGGTADGLSNDSVGPEINLYLNTPTFQYGASVNATPTLVAELRDTSGLNTSGNGLGHDILLVIDNNPNWTWVLNSLFENAEGDYTAGRVMFTLPELPEGKHELMLRAWDVMNNSTTVYLGFKVVNDLKPKFSIDVTASPARENTSFVITHDRPGQNASVTIQVSSTDGMLQWSKTCRDESGSGVTVVDWNLHGNSGHRMQPGLYIVRAIVGTDGGGSSSASCKLVIVGR